MSAKVVLVVPAYNEAARLDTAAFLAHLDAYPDCSLLFVDDGSTDDTAACLAALRDRAPTDRIGILTMRANAGKAEAVRAGLQRAFASGADMVGFADADLSAPLSEVSALVDELEAHPEAWAAIGSRVKLLGRHIERSEMRHYLGRVFATCASIALGLPVYDTQCGLKLFRNVAELTPVVASPFLSRWIFDVELIARIANAAGGDAARRIREVPLERWEEKGSSRLGLADFLTAPIELWRIRAANLPRISPPH